MAAVGARQLIIEPPNRFHPDERGKREQHEPNAALLTIDQRKYSQWIGDVQSKNSIEMQSDETSDH
jgi:hypothetical protein